MRANNFPLDCSMSPDNNPGVSTLGQRLKHAMAVRGIKNNELDRLMGKKGYVSRLANDQRPNASAETVSRAAQALGVRVEWLMRGEEPMEESTDGSPTGPSVSIDPAPAASGMPMVFGAIPGWETAERIARKRHPDWPEEAWQMGRMTMGAQLPGAIDPTVVAQFAQAWMLASDPERQRATRAILHARMVSEDMILAALAERGLVRGTIEHDIEYRKAMDRLDGLNVDEEWVDEARSPTPPPARGIRRKMSS